MVWLSCYVTPDIAFINKDGMVKLLCDSGHCRLSCYVTPDIAFIDWLSCYVTPDIAFIDTLTI